MTTALLAVVLAGCGGSDGVEEGQVQMLDNRFEPIGATVSAGESIDFVNDGRVDHNVIAVDGSFDSTTGGGNQTPGESWTHTFDQVGRFDYYCSLHAVQDGDGIWQGMVGTITVTESTATEPEADE